MNKPKTVIIAAHIDPCPQCGKESVLVLQLVDQEGPTLVGRQQRARSQFTLCFWCLRREELEPDPENLAQWRSVEALPGDGVNELPIS